MKKLFSSLCVFAIICLLAFSGCSDGWTEVQSITYYTDSHSTTYTSMVYRKIKDIETITESEYAQAPESQKEFRFDFFTFDLEIPVNRKPTIKKVKNSVGKTVYSTSDRYYHKFVVESYELRYVKIRFSENDCLEINYYDSDKNKTEKVKPTSYEITYFED